MRRLVPYTTGLWLAEYIDIRCQLCRVYRSTSQPQLLSHSLPNTHQSLKSQSELTNLSSTASFDHIRHYAHHWLNSGLLCTHCHNSIAWLPQSFEVDIAAGVSLPIQVSTYYDYPIRQAIQAFKHHEDMTKLPLLSHALRQLPRPHGCHRNNSMIVAMPTTSQRLIKRGFDPVSILSAQLSKHWRIPLWQGVKRIDDTVSQQGLTRAERLSNLDNAFILTKKPPVKRVLLFDDVSTTGASLQALARAFIASENMVTTHTQNCHISAYALAHGSQS